MTPSIGIRDCSRNFCKFFKCTEKFNGLQISIFSEILVVLFSEVRLYPNPSEDEISLIFTDYSTYSLNIFDLKGQKIMQKTIFDNEASVDISEFQKGTYLLKIGSMSDEKTITKKIIKQ